jgi:hypothetical protein
MKNIAATIIVLSLLFAGVVSAQEDGDVDPGLTPDNAFYFLDTIGEKISMFFTFKAERKAEKALRFAEEKFAEAKAMAERNSAKALEKADERYQFFLELANSRVEEAKNEGKDVEAIAARITENALRHRERFLEVLDNAPEEAREGLERALETSQRGFDNAVQAVTGEKREELRNRIEEANFSPRDFCLENGASQELCEKIPGWGFGSFEGIKSFCLETGGTEEICSQLEPRCREAGVIRPNECFRVLTTSSLQAYNSAQLETVQQAQVGEGGNETKTQTQAQPQQIQIQAAENVEPVRKQVQCEFKEMIFYYSDSCGHCQHVKSDGSLEELEKLGVKITRINAQVGPINHQFRGVPTFVVNDQVYSGYRNLEGLKELLHCE